MAGVVPLFSSGETIVDRYRVEGLLGQGGMAAVYRARHTGTDKLCALKFLLPGLARQPRFREQFLMEARIAGKLGSHPNIVGVFDTGMDDKNKIPFIAMELLEGQTLTDLLRAAGPLSRDVVAAILKQLASALDHAHRAGVVHRDLKPSNIFMIEDYEGQLQLKVLDLAKPNLTLQKQLRRPRMKFLLISNQSRYGTRCARRSKSVLVLAGLLLAVILAVPSSAQADDEAKARQLFKEGRALLKEGKLDEACAKLAKSMNTYASVGPLLNLALCHEMQGRTATAFDEYSLAARLAERAGRPDRAR